MKRKAKSGYEKRLERKSIALKEAAIASGQTYLFSMFDSARTSTSKTVDSVRGSRDQGSSIVISNAVVSKTSEFSISSMEDDESCKAVNECSFIAEKEVNGDDAKEEDAKIDTVKALKPAISSSKISCTNGWYKGKKLDLNWQLLAEPCLELRREAQKGQQRRRPVITCMLCSEYELEVKRFAVNGRIPIVRGIRVDGKDRLRTLIDHLFSSIHNEALRLKQLEDAWNLSSDSHPWVKVMKQCKAQTLEFLIRMAVDVYNDCRVETLSARSWPSRSLATEHSNALLHAFETEGWDAEFIPFSQPSSIYHYRDPTTYAEMRDIIAQHEI